MIVQLKELKEEMLFSCYQLTLLPGLACEGGFYDLHSYYF